MCRKYESFENIGKQVKNQVKNQGGNQEESVWERRNRERNLRVRRATDYFLPAVGK